MICNSKAINIIINEIPYSGNIFFCRNKNTKYSCSQAAKEKIENSCKISAKYLASLQTNLGSSYFLFLHVICINVHPLRYSATRFIGMYDIFFYNIHIITLTSDKF